MTAVVTGLPWWAAILIAAITLVAGLGGVAAKDRLDARAEIRKARTAAYLRLAAASEVVALRSAIYGSQRSVRYALGQTLGETQKLLLVLALKAFPGIGRRLTASDIQLLSGALPTPTQSVDVVDDRLLRESFEELVHARVGVQVLGTPAAIESADNLLDAARALFEFQHANVWRPKASKSAKAVEMWRLRDVMLDKHLKFLSEVRGQV